MLYSVYNENDLLWKDLLAVILFIYLFWLLFSQLSTCIWLYYYKRDGSLWQALTLDLQNARFSARGKIWDESGWGLPGIWH